jgi:alcohol dehydrogenase class IV
MQYNRPACAAAFADLAHTIGIDQANLDEDALSQRFIDSVTDLLASIGIPRSLQQLGLAEDDRDQVAEAGLAATRLVKNNPRPLDLAAMRHITYAAYSGDRNALRNI